MATDKVNHPPHYKVNGLECIDVIEALDLNFRLANAFKYIGRSGRKDPSALEDLKKARWYLDREIQAQERVLAKGTRPSSIVEEMKDP